MSVATPSTQAVPAAVVAAALALPEGEAASVHVSLSKIVPSKTNRRIVRNAEKDAELLESIKTHGVIQPVVLRPIVAVETPFHKLNEKPPYEIGETIYELVAGHRRYEAAGKAGKLTMPAVIRKLTDVQALELQNIENLQREDLDPIDRAWAVRDLYETYRKEKMTAQAAKDRIAQSLSCKRRNVEYMMSLSNLVPDAEKVLRAGEISVSHDYLLAKISNASQKEMLEWMKEEARYDDSYPSVRDLQRQIEQDVFIPLENAPWKMDDKTVAPGRVACNECQKNTKVNPDAGTGQKAATCTDASCYKEKSHHHLVQIETSLKASGILKFVRIATDYSSRPKKNEFLHPSDWRSANKGSCKDVVVGLEIDGNVGAQRLVCTNKKCKVHYSSSIDTYRSSSSRPAPKQSSKEMKDRKVHNTFRRRLLTAVHASLPGKVTDDQVCQVAQFVAKQLGSSRCQYLAACYGLGNDLGAMQAEKAIEKHVAGMKPADAARFLFSCTTVDDLLIWSSAKPSPLKPTHPLSVAAKKYKVKPEPIFAQVEAEILKKKGAQASAQKAKA